MFDGFFPRQLDVNNVAPQDFAEFCGNLMEAKRQRFNCIREGLSQKGDTTYLVVGYQFRAKDPIIVGGRLLVSEGVECNTCDVRGADERNLAVFARGVDLALVLDRAIKLLLREIL